MRLHVMSDLHLEFGKMPRDYRQPDCDAVLLAGDIATGVVGVMWAAEAFNVPVVMIPGNHEFYGKRVWHSHIDKMKAKAHGTNVTVLNDEAHLLHIVKAGRVETVQILGSTLWADFDLHATQHLSMWHAGKSMNDYRQIMRAIQQPLTAEDTRQFCMVSKFFITEELRKPNRPKTVVMTHHAPSELSIPERYRDDRLTPAYASRLEHLMLDYAPALWVHGHIHDNADYQVGETRVVCNPRGYVGDELNPGFDPTFVVEV